MVIRDSEVGKSPFEIAEVLLYLYMYVHRDYGVVTACCRYSRKGMEIQWFKKNVPEVHSEYSR